ncbi:MAG: NADH-quinone oxidoreductase subunit J [Isosphaeraceae bacterium]
MVQYVFLLVAAIGLAAALGTVLARNLVHAALFLVAFFFMVACQFVLLEAEFLAAVQVLVYIGAVAIILMFGIMLTRNIQGDDTTIVAGAWKIPALVAGLCVFAILAFGINNAVAPRGQSAWTGIAARPSIAAEEIGPQAASRREAVHNMARTVGKELMSRYVVAFEVAGLLLTAALVGAIALAHREEDMPEPAEFPGRAGREAAGNGPPRSPGPAMVAAGETRPG